MTGNNPAAKARKREKYLASPHVEGMQRNFLIRMMGRKIQILLRDPLTGKPDTWVVYLLAYDQHSLLVQHADTAHALGGPLLLYKHAIISIRPVDPVPVAELLAKPKPAPDAEPEPSGEVEAK